MRRIERIMKFSTRFRFKTLCDDKHNEYVLFRNSSLKRIENIEDRTAFEATENHIHLMENLSDVEFDACVPIAEKLGQNLLASLREAFPDKKFVVYVTISKNDSMIIRFHQKWEHELPYYDPGAFDPEQERVLMFE